MDIGPYSALLCLLAALSLGVAVPADAAPESAPFINTWLVAGPFENDAQNAALARDDIRPADVAPREGTETGGRAWRYFDDRLFSRNYDDYQDLYSYFSLKRNEPAGPRAAYAHVYVHSDRAQAAQLRVGADSAFRSWLNGEVVAQSEKSTPHRDAVKADVSLRAGWNRLLLQVACPQAGRFGFYARLCDTAGNRLPGLTVSTGGGDGSLEVATGPMPDAQTGDLPAAFREWPYVGADPLRDPDPEMEAYLRRKPHFALHASDFVLTAQGGAPPYRWSVAQGSLPKGLRLDADGTLSGTLAADEPLREYRFTAQVTDAAGKTARKDLRLAVKERPNRWYEAARLVGLMHSPESPMKADDPAGTLAEFARRMKQQGYALGMMIAYNNGDFKYRFPSRFEPEPETGDLASLYRAALEKEGVRFGLYMGNLIGPNHGGDDGALVMVEEAVRRYRPAALWFDWASPDPDGYVSPDALYSAIRTLSPDTVIVLNGINTLYHGDWDVVCVEGWGAWGEKAWATWPFPIRWPKRVIVETWRMLPDPAFEYSPGVRPDWQEQMRVALSVIGQGFVANLDHSPTITQPFRTLAESPVAEAHRKMAEWASPPGLPPLTESYTQVDPAPLAEAGWGYATVNLSRDALYLHMLKNPYGKAGLPAASFVTVGPVGRKVREARWMNRDAPLRFEQKGDRLTVSLADVTADPVDTILKVTLDGPLPPAAPRRTVRREPVPYGNLAYEKPARLLSVDGERPLIASAFAFARYGVDGLASTHAQGAYEWAWAYQVDLERARPVRRVVIHFTPGGYATEYNLLLSADGKTWRTVAAVKDGKGGTREHAFAPVRARYVRVQAVKPDGPGQEGGQMGISELEVYE